MKAVALSIALLVGATACAPDPAAPFDCRGLPGSPALVATLYFGRDIVGRDPVSDSEWADFLAGEVTPRFPDGLTALDGTGQWLDPKENRVTAEATKILVIAADAAPATLRKIEEVRTAYKTRFRQASVGLVTTRGCASFD